MLFTECTHTWLPATNSPPQIQVRKMSWALTYNLLEQNTFIKRLNDYHSQSGKDNDSYK